MFGNHRPEPYELFEHFTIFFLLTSKMHFLRKINVNKEMKPKTSDQYLIFRRKHMNVLEFACE